MRTVASGKGAPTIVMNGGVIENCFAYYGGAFYLCNNNFAFDTTLTINGGVIRNCVAANAASLADATHKGEGSAIYAASKKGQAVVTINGGEITGCQADRYGVMTVGQNTDYYNVRFNIFGGHIHGNVQGASFTDIEEARGRGIFVYRLYSSKNPTTPLVTIGGNALIDDEIYLNSNADGNWLEIREDFTGRAKIHAKNEANGLLIAKAVTMDGQETTASAEILSRLTYLRNELDENGNVVTSSAYTIVKDSENENQYILASLHTVTYNDGADGVCFEEQSYVVTYGSETPAFEGELQRTGYTFTGWEPEVSETVTGDVTYTATWSQNNYTITLDPNGGSVYARFVVVHYGQPVGSLPVPVRDGYRFMGWVDENGEAVNAATVYELTTGTVYTAVWQAKTYDITVVYGNGEDDEVITATYDELVEFPEEPVRKGYEFAGWVDENGNPVDAEKPYDASYSELHADWTAKTYSLPVDLGNGQEAEDVEATYDELVEFPENPVRDGYTFGGWVDENGNPIDTEKPYDESYNEIHAVWTVNGYTVTLDPNGGKVEPTTITATYGEPVGKLPVPTREGYDFAGWLDAFGNKVTAESPYKVAGNSTFTASWTAKTYSLPVDLGNGEEAEDLDVTYGEKVEFPEDPVRDGYTFDGWVDENGNPIDTEKPYDESYGEIHASWKANTYTLHLDADGGKVEPDTLSVVYGSAIGELPVPTRKGYDFKGWYDAQGNQVTAETLYKVAGDATITAKWTAKSDIPQTGDLAPVGMYVMLVLASAAAILFLENKKRQAR